MSAGQGAQQRVTLPKAPFTLGIELDAWNIRERDAWGQSAQPRAAGQEPSRWDWVSGGTCFRLDQRVQSDGGRGRILSRGPVMTRGGVDELRAQLFAEAQWHGLAQAAKVRVVADGAVWIWNLAGDRFPQAQQRLDYDRWHFLFPHILHGDPAKIEMRPAGYILANFLFFTCFPVILRRSDLRHNGRRTHTQFQHHRPH